MEIAVLDLEWNGAYSRRLKGFINEIIEFGAVLVDENLNIIDTFEALIRPQVGKKISGKISTLTSITDGDLQDGLQFMQAVSRFGKWARGAVIMTWGTSDVLALIENCRYFCGSGRIPFLDRYVDLQAYCERMLHHGGGGQQMGVSAAAALLGIDENGFDHHRALGDSMLELRCFQKVYTPESLAAFVQDAGDAAFYDRMEFRTVSVCDLHHPLIRPQDLAFFCEKCGRRAKRVGEWELHNKGFRAVFECRNCGIRFSGRVRFKLKYEGLVVTKKIRPCTEEKPGESGGRDAPAKEPPCKNGP